MSGQIFMVNMALYQVTKNVTKQICTYFVKLYPIVMYVHTHSCVVKLRLCWNLDYNLIYHFCRHAFQLLVQKVRLAPVSND